jgi:1,4-alpha-glucan branching enzyme
MGFNCIQLMGIPDHAYYGSFGYQVTNMFAPSGRFGPPDSFRALVDDAHGLGLKVVLDICLSHASTNADDGIGDMDGSGAQYFYPGERGYHSIWDCKIYDLTKTEVVKYLINALLYYRE